MPVTTSSLGGSRLRAYLEFIAAVVFFFIARSVAHHAAFNLASELWVPVTEQAALVFELVVGFAALGMILDRQKNPVAAQGLPRRPGWSREVGLGLAVGWAMALACVLFLAVDGGIAVVFSSQLPAWGWLLADALFFALAAMAEEVAFRGYGFQRFAEVVGPVGATLGFSAFYAVIQAVQPGSTRLSIAVSLLLSIVLCSAYLRTRALWVSWGLNFGWKASRALIFGLAVSGVSSHSSVIEGDPMGPFWLTGGGYGLDGSWLAFFALVIALPIVFRVTRELDFLHNAPVIVAGGIPVDLDDAARRQHESQMGSSPPSSPLVQILPISPASEPKEPVPEIGQDGVN
jgi:membrane protease YdiL (CAAX protease family)